jgi:hypothetical protein
MDASYKFILTVVLWAVFYALFSGFLYLIMWTLSIQEDFSWKLGLGIMILWILVVRLFKIAGGRAL